MARGRFSARSWVLFAIALGGVWAWLSLGIGFDDIWPSPAAWRIAERFLVGALTPALEYQSEFVPDGAPPLLIQALDAAGQTVLFAAAAMGLALVMGLVLGFFASSAWWSDERIGGRSRTVRIFRRTLAPVLWGSTRALIAVLRSVHELLWAVLFLCAFGLGEITAVFAIAIPFSGTLAKIFAELVDESPRDAAGALAALGATPMTTFCCGLLPGALPDMAAYSFYRFECALRSSAVLGFFGYPTLGLTIKLAFENTNYREAWTYIYTLFALIVVFEAWSGALRRRLAR